jgi:hypothetical protein
MTSPLPEMKRQVAVVWNPERLPNDGDCIVLHVHQHSLHPLTQTLGYVCLPNAGGAPRFVASDANPPIKFAFNAALAYAEREGVGAIAIIDPVGFGWLELKGAE